jgi:hypothetical protein
MIRPGFDEGVPLETFRRQFRDSRPRFAMVPMLLTPESMEVLRTRVRAAGWRPFLLADRGRYEVNDMLVDEELFEPLRQFAERITESRLQVGEPARWLRLRHGDYALIRDDSFHLRAQPPRHLELTLDFSEDEHDQAHIVYTDGQQGWIVPQSPGTLALFERAGGFFRYDRYLPHTVGDAEVHRLRLPLHFVEP